MKRYLCMLLVATMVLLTGCGAIEDAKSSTIYVNKKGKVTSVIVEKFSKDYYDKDELKKGLEKTIDTYNNENGQTAVSLKKCTVKNEEVRVILEYDTCADYEAFNSVKLFCGTVNEAKDAGFDFKIDFLNKTGDNISGATVLEQNPEAQVIILKEPIRVKTEDDILYVSENASVIESTIAQIHADDDQDNENAQITISNYAYIIYK